MTGVELMISAALTGLAVGTAWAVLAVGVRSFGR